MSRTQYSLGIDVGTTSVKALLLDEDGHVAAVASARHGVDPTADGVQADPESWWSSMRAALADLAARADLGRVGAIGFSGNMSSVVLVDDDLVPLAPALLLADKRGAAQLDALGADLRERVVCATGNLPGTIFALSSLLWWRDTSPELLGRTTAFLSAKDFLRARLTGRIATDRTDAYNSLLLDARGRWDGGLIDALGLPRSIFPEVLTSGELAGRTTEGAVEELPLPPGVPVASGAGDVAAALVGAGGLPANELAVSLGTSVTLMAALGPDAPGGSGAESAGAVTRHPGADGSWFALGSLLTGGLAVNWLRETVGDTAIAAAGDLPDADDRLLFLPYLAGTGSPDFDDEAAGVMLGITPSTTAAQLVSGALEAVAFDLAGLIERLETHRGLRYRAITASGGGTRIAAWPQILADVTGLPVRLLDQPDLSAVGAAVLGWTALGLSVRPRHGDRTVGPRAEHASSWALRRERYVAARALVLDLTHRLATTTQESARQRAAQ